jgi:hypothetical protein
MDPLRLCVPQLQITYISIGLTTTDIANVKGKISKSDFDRREA